MSRNSQAPPENLNQDDWDKMISDATFYLLVADQKKALIKRTELMAACNLKNLKRPDADRAIEKVSSCRVLTPPLFPPGQGAAVPCVRAEGDGVRH